MCGILATLTNLTPVIQLWDSSGLHLPFYGLAICVNRTNASYFTTAFHMEHLYTHWRNNQQLR